VVASFDTHSFWEALTSHPYWHGALLAFELTCATLGAASVLAFFLALGLLSRVRVLRALALVYNWFFRAIPTLLLLLLVWNGLPQLWHVFTGSWYKAFLAAFFALTLNEAAYMSEIIRAGLISVDPGQELAGRALGMTRARILRRVVLPQAIRIIIPPTANEFITLLKLTSLASAISLYELLGSSIVRAGRDFSYIEAYSAAAVYYLAIVSVLMFLQARLERRFTWRSSARGRQRVSAPAVPAIPHDAR